MERRKRDDAGVGVGVGGACRGAWHAARTQFRLATGVILGSSGTSTCCGREFPRGRGDATPHPAPFGEASEPPKAWTAASNRDSKFRACPSSGSPSPAGFLLAGAALAPSSHVHPGGKELHLTAFPLCPWLLPAALAEAAHALLSTSQRVRRAVHTSPRSAAWGRGGGRTALPEEPWPVRWLGRSSSGGSDAQQTTAGGAATRAGRQREV